MDIERLTANAAKPDNSDGHFTLMDLAASFAQSSQQPKETLTMDPVLVGAAATIAAAVISVAIHLDGRRRSRSSPAAPPPPTVVMTIETVVLDAGAASDHQPAGPAPRLLRIRMTPDAQAAKAEWADDRSER